MNKQRRNKLGDAIIYLNTVKDMIKDVKTKEEFAFDNMPENLQYSNKGCDMEENIDEMEEIIDGIDELISSIDNIRYK